MSERLKTGFTTGSCAAAAAKAAAYMLFAKEEVSHVTIKTPKGIIYEPEILDIKRRMESVKCAVRKYAGDDPDVTAGMLIYAQVTARAEKSREDVNVHIDGGEGVGRVTKPGLDQPVGAAAINSMPRRMITQEVLQVCRDNGFTGDIYVEISVPGGEEKAAETFNPKLGIKGGLSIIGTSGIVEPMSTRAVIETIRVQFCQRKAMGYDRAVVTFGNYGRTFLLDRYGYDIDLSIKCSNFIGEALDIAREMEFKSILIAGHIGKMVKLSGGIMNTHSSFADCRMELMAAACVRAGVPVDIISGILNCTVTEEAISLLEGCGMKEQVMDRLMERILYHIRNRLKDTTEAECIMYSNEYGLLAESEGAEKWLTLLEQEQEQLI